MDIVFQTLSHILNDAIYSISRQPFLIRAVTAILSGCCAAVILLVWKLAVSEERWAKYLGLAFSIYAIEYGLLSGFAYGVKLELVKPGVDSHLYFVAALGSGLTNLFFLAAARDLLGNKKPFPWWSLLVTSIGAAFLFDNAISGHRIPDAIISTLCVGALGYATSRNLGLRFHSILSVAALVVAGIYGIIQIAYSIVPFLSESELSVVTNYVASQLRTSNSQELLKAPDTIVITLVLLLKLGLFFVALYLLMQAMMVVSANQARKMLKGLLDGKQEYLSGDGIIKSIGEITGASEVSMHLLLPGHNVENVAQFEWSNRTPPIPKPRLYRLSSAKSSVAEAVIKGEGEVIYSKRIEMFSQLNLTLEDVDPKTSIVAVPVRFHGAIIGCLSVKWQSGTAFTRTAIKQIKNLADLMAPIAQSYREIAALDQLSFRFTGWHAGKQAIYDIRGALREMAYILHDIISPLATIISMNFGFQMVGGVQQDNGQSDTFSQELINDEFAREARLNSENKKRVDIVKGRLLVKIQNNSDDKFNELPIGELVFVVPLERDEPTQPTLARQYLHRRAIRAIVADELLEISRQHLNGVLKDFGVRLNSQQVANVGEWFYEIWRAAKEAGLIWAVASQMNDDELIGSPTWKKVIEEIDREPRDSRDKSDEEDNIKVIHLDPPVGDACHIIKLYLGDTKTWLWLGVGRKEFGPEIEFPSPWKVFLERFAEIADSSLSRLTAMLEFQRLQIETAQAQGLATVAVTTGTLHHQLTNLVRDIANPISTLNEALKVGWLNAEGHLGEIIMSMKESADVLLNLSAEVMNVTKIDDHRPCSLLEAAEKSRSLFGIALDQGKISLEISVYPELEVDVPFHVASLAIANLVSNAKDAMISVHAKTTLPMLDDQIHQNNGDLLFSAGNKDSIERVQRFIRIEAKDMGEMIHCQVTDNGPGVKSDICERIFNLGATTKHGSGGWGLYLVKRSLQENRGYIDLTKPGPEGTQFTIRFPKPRLEI